MTVTGIPVINPDSSSQWPLWLMVNSELGLPSWGRYTPMSNDDQFGLLSKQDAWGTTVRGGMSEVAVKINAVEIFLMKDFYVCISHSQF